MSSVVSIDPDAPVVPDALAAPAQGTGSVVALLAEGGARAAGWPDRVAVALASAWADAGVHVALCDGDLRAATLHDTLGTENHEGLSDVILYGASPRRVARPIDGRGFLFVSSGTVVADPATAYLHPRWDGILSAFRESGAALLLYLPAERPEVAELAERADRIVRLASSRPSREPAPGVVVLHSERTDTGAEQASPAATDPDEVPPEATAHGPTGSGIEVVTEEGPRDEARAGDDPADDEGVGEGGDVEPAPEGIAGAGASTTLDESSSLVGSEPPPRPEPRRRISWVVLLLLVVVGAILLSAWLGLLAIPGITLASPAG